MLIKTIKTELLETFVYETRSQMGKAAAAEAAKAIRKTIGEKGFANVIFAAAPSQNEMLEALLLEDLEPKEHLPYLLLRWLRYPKEGSKIL